MMELLATSDHDEFASVARSAFAASSDPWSTLAEIGLPGVLISEEYGGLEQDARVIVPVFDALGSFVSLAPWTTLIVTGPLLVEQAAKQGNAGAVHLLTSVIAGERRVVEGIHHDGTVVCRSLDFADIVIAVVDHELVVMEAEEFTKLSRRDLLGRELWFHGSSAVAGEHWTISPEGFELARAQGRIAAASAQLATGQAALSLAIEYAKTRKQFGSPVGSFQSVKHLLADAHVALSMAKPLVTGAAVSVAARHECISRDAAIALLGAGAAARSAVQIALQVHGAMGYTDEVSIGAFLSQVELLGDGMGSEHELRMEWELSMFGMTTQMPIGGMRVNSE